MERVTYLQNKIDEALEEYLKDLRQPSNENIEFIAVADTKSNHFQIIAMGWEKYYKHTLNL